MSYYNEEREPNRYAPLQPDMEMQHLPSSGSKYHHGHTPAVHDGPEPQPMHNHASYSEAYDFAQSRVREFWDRLRGKGRRPVGWGESMRNIVMSSYSAQQLPSPYVSLVSFHWRECLTGEASRWRSTSGRTLEISL
ncbi:hypothetical protein C8Q80DRAFT_134147 [Daedaleopsis nitida]|nr:hypothetical protein C8Q80DRAFT_134147 [Daedaleopsis nitida]